MTKLDLERELKGGKKLVDLFTFTGGQEYKGVGKGFNSIYVCGHLFQIRSTFKLYMGQRV